MPIFNTDLNTFQASVIQASHNKPILLDIWADWCSPCLVLAPMLKKIDFVYAGKIDIAKLEADDGDNMKIAGQYKVRGFPTVILFRHGQEAARFSGARPMQFIREFIDPYIDAT
jgi:thioredoxin 1